MTHAQDNVGYYGLFVSTQPARIRTSRDQAGHKWEDLSSGTDDPKV